MAQARSASSDFNQALGEAKKQASHLAGEASDAAQDVYEHARDRAVDLAESANEAARQTAGSLGRALRNTIETQPYTAVAIALGLGWLLGRPKNTLEEERETEDQIARRELGPRCAVHPSASAAFSIGAT